MRTAQSSISTGPALRLALLLCLSAVLPLAAQAPVTHDSVTVVPGPQFSTTSWIRWLGTPLFGARYRQLWNTPITLPLLDLAATGGGLRLARQGTGHEVGLYFFDGADGTHWTFWPLDRTDPRNVSAGIMPASVNKGIIEDLTSGRNPAGPLVASALAHAAGIPNQQAWLLALPPDVLPGDSTPGQPRAGYLLAGDPVARPDSAGPVQAGDVITSLAMLHRRLTDARNSVNEVATLQALLFNVYVGDLDPGFLYWRWEALASPTGVTWRPLGLFREAALARYDGVVAYLGRPLQPDLTTFGPRYAHTVTGIPDQASAFRLLLGGLPRSTWDSTAQLIRDRLTDSVIADAVARMPAVYQTKWGERFARVLRERRDKLPELVEWMYKSVRKNAEVFATTDGEAVHIEWPTRDSLRIGFGGQEQRFSAEETRRVTLFLEGGTDSLHFAGAAGRAPELRIVPPPGEGPLFVAGDPTGSPVAVYGKEAAGSIVSTDPIRVRTTDVDDALASIDSTGAERAEGHKSLAPTFWFALSSGVGVLIGGGVVRTDWGGETRPYRNRVKLRAGYGSDSKKGVVELLGDFRWNDSPLRLEVQAVASGVGAIYFYGLGNDTPGDSTESYYRAGRNLYGLAPTLVLPLSERIRVGAGFVLKSVDTPVPDTLYIGVSQPYGTPTFSEAGMSAEFIFDSRDVTGAPRSGALGSLTGVWYPVTDVQDGGFGTVTASIAKYWTPHGWPAMTVAARLSGTHTWGNVPYFEAAFIGGGRTVRGLPQGRFEGNQAAFANLDLRYRTSQIQFVLPWDFGILGLADIGRVWVSGEASDTWHPSFGAGLWAALLDRSMAASLSVATGAGQGVFITAFGGFSF